MQRVYGSVGIAAALAVAPWVGGGVASAACSSPAGTQEVAAAIERAEGAFGNVDLEGFTAATDALVEMLPCVGEVVPRNTAAAVHRIMGLRAFVDRDPDQTTRAFAAARSVEPAYKFPEMLVPEGHPVLADYGAIAVTDPPIVPVPDPAGGYVQIDGRNTLERPTKWPALVQIVSDDGSVRQTAYLWPADPWPEYTIEVSRPQVAAGTTDVGPPVPQTVGASVPLVAVGGTALIASGVLYAVASGAAKTYHDPATPYGELDTLRARTNTMQWVSGGLAVAGAGVGVGAVVVGQW